jgi:glutathione-specific gamma-glutamylcyclotransferase
VSSHGQSLPDASWVFGYGSLMWNPGFAYEERRNAEIRGLHRALCIWSHVHRGTPERPGLVLGLDLGGACHGVAFRVAPENWAATVDYLRQREQVTSVYIEIVHEAALDDGRRVSALAYRADRHHPQYCGILSRERILETVRGAVGLSGANPDYVLATHDHLEELGIPDETLSWLTERLR